MKIFRKIILLLLLVISIQIAPVKVSGAIGIPCATQTDTTYLNERIAEYQKNHPGTSPEDAKKKVEMCGFNDIFRLINNVVTFFLKYVLLPFSILLISYAGFLFLVSGGNPDKKTKAKTIFKNLLIGILLVLFSWSIVYFVFRAFGYDTSGGRGGLDDDSLSWKPSTVNANITTGGSTSTIAQAGDTTTYGATMSVNSTVPSNTRITVTVIPVAKSKMAILVSCLSDDGSQRVEAQGSIPTGSTTATVSLKLSPGTGYECSVENTLGSLSMLDSTDGAFRTPSSGTVNSFRVTGSKFNQNDFIISYENAASLGASHGFLECKDRSGVVVIPQSGIAIDRTTTKSSFSYNVNSNIKNGIQSDTDVTCVLTVYDAAFAPITSAVSGRIYAPKQNALATVFQVIRPVTFKNSQRIEMVGGIPVPNISSNLQLVINGSINVDPNLDLRCASLGVNHLFRAKVSFDPTAIQNIAGVPKPPKDTFNAPVIIPIAWNGYGLRPLSFYICEINGKTVRNVAEYSNLPVVPVLDVFSFFTPPISLIKLPESKLLYPVSVGIPKPIFTSYTVPAKYTPNPNNPYGFPSTFKQSIPTSMFIPVTNGIVVDNSRMNLTCNGIFGPASGSKWTKGIVVSDAPASLNWLTTLFGNGLDTGFTIEINNNPATGFMHSSSYNCLLNFTIENRPQARSFFVNTPVYIDPTEVGPVVLAVENVVANTNNAFFTVVASPRIESSTEYSCSNVTGNYSGQVSWVPQALGIKIPVAIPISTTLPGLKPKTTYNCNIDGVTYQKEKVNYQFIIKTP